MSWSPPGVSGNGSLLCDNSRLVAPLISKPRESTEPRSPPCSLGPPISIEAVPSIVRRSRIEDCPIVTTPQPVKRPPAISHPRDLATEARPRSALPQGPVLWPHLPLWARIEIAPHRGFAHSLNSGSSLAYSSSRRPPIGSRLNWEEERGRTIVNRPPSIDRPRRASPPRQVRGCSDPMGDEHLVSVDPMVGPDDVAGHGVVHSSAVSHPKSHGPACRRAAEPSRSQN